MATKPAGPAVMARKQARAAMAAVTAAAREREHADAEDLADVLKAGAKIDRAAAKRDKDIAAAQQTYAATAATVEAEEAAALARIKARGTDETALATLTGFELGEVRRLLRLAAPAAAGRGSGSVGKPPAATRPVAE
ncbi:hypothetical protein [Nocardia sp. NPDC004722]